MPLSNSNTNSNSSDGLLAIAIPIAIEPKWTNSNSFFNSCTTYTMRILRGTPLSNSGTADRNGMKFKPQIEDHSPGLVTKCG